MVSYRDVQHLRTPHKTRKNRKSRKGRGTRRHKKYHKGSASKTHPGRKDFTTKKGSKYYNRGDHRYRYAQGSIFAGLPYILGLKRKTARKGRKGRGRKGRGRKGRKASRR